MKYQEYPQRERSGFVRGMSWWDVLVITIAAPTGSGIIYYSVQTSNNPGGSIALAFLIGMFIFLPMVLSSIVLVSAMPKSGGPYFGISRILHPSIGYLSAMLLLLGDALVVGVLGFIAMGIMGAMFASVGQAYQVNYLISIGGALQSSIGSIIGGILWVIIFWRIMLLKQEKFRKIMSAFLLIPLIASLASIILFFTFSGSETKLLFDKLWGTGVWNNIIDSAQQLGWQKSTFSLDSTFGLLLVVIWAFNGIEVASYAAGEVRAPTRSYWKGILLGWVIVGTLYLLQSYSVHFSYGNFINAYDFLSQNHREVLATILPVAITPSIPFYFMALIKSPILALIIGLAFVLWIAKIMPAGYLITTRLIFRLSMDRYLPSFLTSINQKTANATWATHITAIIAAGGVFLYFLQVETILGSLMFCTMFIGWAIGLASFMLPFKYPDLIPFNWWKKKIGIPVISWLGLITMVSSLFLLYLTIRHMSIEVIIFLIVIISLMMINFAIRYSKIDKFPE